MSKLREDFEEFCKANQIDTEIDSDPYWKGQKYAAPYTQGAWEAWQHLHKKHQDKLEMINQRVACVEYHAGLCGWESETTYASLQQLYREVKG